MTGSAEQVQQLGHELAAAVVDLLKQPARDVSGPLKSSLEILSLCVLVVKNGFTVIGKSAPASADNFNADLGRKLAYEDAIRQLWPFMGFALRERLSQS